MPEIIFDAKKKKKKAKISSLLTELTDLEEDELPSDIYTKKKEEKDQEKIVKIYEEKEKAKKDLDFVKDTFSENIDEDWLNTLSNFKTPKTGKKGKNKFDFEISLSKKGKNKDSNKKKKSGPISHKKDFDMEMTLLRNLQNEQEKFVDSLQKKYDQMEASKSTSRGIGKFTTDLIMSITSARNLSMQLTKEIINTKKTIADLDFKERKEFGSGAGSEQANLANYAANYLQQAVNMGRNNLVNNESYESFDDVTDSDVDDMFSSIEDALEKDDNFDISQEADTYLKYENENISVMVVWNKNYHGDDLDQQYYFIAVNENGDIIEDYPLPSKTKLTVNLSTKKATDKYGNRYNMILDS